MNKIITVKSTEMATIQTGDNAGNQYLKVHGSDDKTYSIFQEGLWNTLQVGAAVQLTLEKNQKGYWNVTDATSVAKELAEKQQGAQQVEPQAFLKNRAFALSYAKDIACAKIQAGKEATLKDLLNMANSFDLYLEKGLTEDALKLYSQIQKELKKEES